MAVYQSEFQGATIDARLAAVATMQTAISNLESAVAAKYSKPSSGIPETDLAANVQSALALARTAVQSLSDYYTKAQVDDITAAIAASVDSTSGVVVATLPSAGAGTLGKIYYVGPDANGFYDRYVTSYDGSTYSWLALGNTEVDMTQYATVEQLNQLDQELNPSFNTFVEGYITNAGAVDASSNFRRSTPVYLPSGTKLTFQAAGYSDVVAMLSLYQEVDQLYFPLILSADAEVHTFTYDIVESGYYVISYRNASGISINLTVPDIFPFAGSIGNPLVDFAVPFANGKYIALNGGIGTAATPSTQVWSSAYRYSVVPCVEGSQFRITGTGGNAPRLWGFLDKNNIILSVADDGASATNAIITAPANAAKVVFNDSLKTGDFVRLGIVDKIDGMASSVENVTNKLGGTFAPTLGTPTSGKYIDSGGAVQSSSGFSYTTPIYVPDGGSISARAAGYSTNVSMIARYDPVSGLYSPAVVSTDATVRTYSYTAQEGGYFVVSYHTSDGIEVAVTVPDIWAIIGQMSENIEDKAINFVDGKYVTLNGGINTVANLSSPTWNSGYRYSVVACQRGDIFRINAAGGGAPRLWAFLDENDTIIDVAAANSTGINLLLIAPIGAAKLVINDNAKNGSCVKYEAVGIYQAIADDYQENIFAAFDNILAWGDSFTSCVVYTGSNTTRLARRPFPTVLANMSGNTATIVAEGGATASYMWGHYESSIVAKENAIAIVYIGTNAGLTDTVDTDAAGSDPANWANNNTGDYCRTVNKMKAQGYKVLLLRPWTSSGDLAATNAAINDIAEKFGVAVMDAPSTREPKYHLWPNGEGQNSAHLNDIGYAVFAQRLAAQASQLGDTMLSRIFPQ